MLGLAHDAIGVGDQRTGGCDCLDLQARFLISPEIEVALKVMLNGMS
jgi:hypothetical protein